MTTHDDRYDPPAVERHWQAEWERTALYQTDVAQAERPFYNLMMFPYPSAEGLHVGNLYAFTGSDIYGRFTAMRGQDVFEPMGFDAFGTHSENFAIQLGIHPRVLTPRMSSASVRHSSNAAVAESTGATKSIPPTRVSTVGPRTHFTRTGLATAHLGR
jgi:leucyl-tRNA synthetase